MSAIVTGKRIGRPEGNRGIEIFDGPVEQLKTNASEPTIEVCVGIARGKGEGAVEFLQGSLVLAKVDAEQDSPIGEGERVARIRGYGRVVVGQRLPGQAQGVPGNAPPIQQAGISRRAVQLPVRDIDRRLVIRRRRGGSSGFGICLCARQIGDDDFTVVRVRVVDECRARRYSSRGRYGRVGKT